MKKIAIHKYFYVGAAILTLLIYVWVVGVLILTKQTDLLLILSILLSTALTWGAWYSFLRQKFYILIPCVIALLVNLTLGYFAFMDVVAPVLTSTRGFSSAFFS